MPEKNPPRDRATPSILGLLGAAEVEERACMLADGVNRDKPAREGNLAAEVLEEIAALSARAWGSNEERDVALRAINGLALAALAQIRQR